MELLDQFRCLFSAQVERHGDAYHFQIPEQELEFGALEEGETYRVAVFPSATSDGRATKSDSDPRELSKSPDHEPKPESSGPPVVEGEQRTVEIENLGDQGDGIARVEYGFVVIVPDTDQGERAIVEITDVRENVAFAEVVKRLSYYE